MEDYRKVMEEGIAYALEHSSFNKVNLIDQAENVCVFGLGTFFEEAFVSKKVKEKYHVNLLCDNDSLKWGKEYGGLTCVSPNQLPEYENLVVIIMLGNPVPVEEQLDRMGVVWVTHADLSLDEMGIPRETEWFQRAIPEIKKAYELFEDEESKAIYVNGICNRIAYPVARLSWQDMYVGNEYFPQPFISLGEDEVYIDCGAYNGDTVLRFADVAKRYGEIHAFEMDRNNFMAMERGLQGKDNVFLYNFGVWEKCGEIPYGRGSGNNEPRRGISVMKQNDGTQYKAKVVNLDKIFCDKRVTFIKMDIEGSEIPALKGAREVIVRNRPKLAVCVYHKTSDFWEIPLLLKQFVPEYRLRMKHHAKVNCLGTVLYARE